MRFLCYKLRYEVAQCAGRCVVVNAATGENVVAQVFSGSNRRRLVLCGICRFLSRTAEGCVVRRVSQKSWLEVVPDRKTEEGFA